MTPPPSAPLDDALATAHDAGATRVPPWLAIVASLASVQPEGIGATIDWLVAHRDALERAYEGGRIAPLATARLPDAMRYEPELGYLDRAHDDHRLRECWLFADIVRERSLFQTTMLAITGIDLPARDAELLEQIGISTLAVDPRAWPMGVTRRVAARTGTYNPALVAGFAMMSSGILGGRSAGLCAQFLRRADAFEREGGSVDALVEQVLARRERVMGFGRPVVGPDERGPVMEGLLREYDRDQLRFVTLVRAAEQSFIARRGLRMTAAGWVAAALSDYGLDPDQVEAVVNAWLSVCVFAQASFSQHQGLREPASI